MNWTSRNNPTSNYTVEDHLIPGILSLIFAFISVLISALTLILVWRIKTRLHTVKHLLICNTCVSSALYCIAISNSFIHLLFIAWNTSDMSCRWRGYFIYVGIASLSYSFFVQGILRFSFCALSSRYRWLTTFKTYRIVLAIKWLLVLILASPTIITNDIHYYPATLCWIPSESLLHTAYTYVAYYITPVILTVAIYIYIFRYIKKMQRNTLVVSNSLNRQKRDLECIRNILILIFIYTVGGLPNIVSDVTMSKYPYLISLVTQVFGAVIANLCTILLDRDLRQTIRTLICRTLTHVKPLNHVHPARRLSNR